MLTVWRRLHVEVDSMAAVTNNFVTNNITGISGSATAATNLTLGINLNSGLTPADASPNLSTSTNLGRFENGTIVIGTGSAATTNSGITGNGDNFVRNAAGFSLPASIVYAGATNGVGNVVALSGGVFTITSNLGTNKYVGGTFRTVGVNFTITTNTATTVTVSGTAQIPFQLHDDDDDTLLPHLPDTGLMVQKFNPAYVAPIVDGGGDANNDKQTISFNANVDATSHTALDAEFNKTGAFESEVNRASDFWVAYILTAYQAQPTQDYDPDGSSEWGPHGVNGGGSSYRRGALFFPESLRDYARQRGHSGAEQTTLEMRSVVHEIGHQFGLQDNTGGLYDYSLVYDLTVDPVFLGNHLNIIRSTASPGQ